MGVASAYNLAGLTEEDAILVARDKRDAALKKLDDAQAEFREWDETHARLLAQWANKHYGRTASDWVNAHSDNDSG